LSDIAAKHHINVHFYAVDTQLYLTCRRDDTAACTSRLAACITEIGDWMASNRLLLNHHKTDLLRCSRTWGSQAVSELVLGGSPVQPLSHVRDLGVQFDDDLSLKKHVDQLTGRCYSQLRHIRSCRRAVTRESAKTVVNSLVVSKVDYCNSVLAACTQQQTDKVQRVLNCAARVILGGSKYDHVTPLIRDDLHWLRVPERITFKLCLFVYKALHGLAPVQSTSS